MFIELTSYPVDRPVSININQITCVHRMNMEVGNNDQILVTVIHTTFNGAPITVIESYATVMKLIEERVNGQ